MATQNRRGSKKVKPFSWVDYISKLEERPVCEDYFLEKEGITKLGPDNFRSLLRDKDVVLVMFHDPCNKNCKLSKNHFLEAARTVERDNAALAEVNCMDNPGLCDKHRVKTVPYFKLYSKSRLVTSVSEYHWFVSKLMKSFVETCPILADRPKPPGRTCPCSANSNKPCS